MTHKKQIDDLGFITIKNAFPWTNSAKKKGEHKQQTKGKASMHSKTNVYPQYIKTFQNLIIIIIQAPHLHPQWVNDSSRSATKDKLQWQTNTWKGARYHGLQGNAVEPQWDATTPPLESLWLESLPHQVSWVWGSGSSHTPRLEVYNHTDTSEKGLEISEKVKHASTK